MEVFEGNDKKRTAIYLRKSKGDKGSTKSQLERIEQFITDLEKSGKIAPVNRTIVGKDIDRKKKFNPVEDLAIEGDIYNEGERKSGFDSARTRPVLNEMLRRVANDEYDIIIAESIDRFTRDILDFGRALNGTNLDLWREKGKVFWGIKDNAGLGDKSRPFNEEIINTQNTWGGAGKKQEIEKSIDALEAKINRGYITSRMKAELIGSGTKNAGLDYRKFWKIAQAFGENAKGRLNKPTDVGKQFGRDHTWASNTYEMFRDWNRVKIKKDLTALEGWLNTIDALNEFIRQQPFAYDRASYKSNLVTNVLSNFNGFLNYPAGVNLSDTYKVAKNQLVNFPYPLDFDFDEVGMTNKPNETIAGFTVLRTPITEEEKSKLLKYQTQFRGKGGRGKKLTK
jgi:hypothetical protein